MRRPPGALNEARAARCVPWWRTCVGCGYQFRWEGSWRGRWAVDQFPRVWLRRWVCSVCAATRADAQKFFGLWRPPRPTGPPPPSPPLRRIGRSPGGSAGFHLF